MCGSPVKVGPSGSPAIGGGSRYGHGREFRRTRNGSHCCGFDGPTNKGKPVAHSFSAHPQRNPRFRP